MQTTAANCCATRKPVVLHTDYFKNMPQVAIFTLQPLDQFKDEIVLLYAIPYQPKSRELFAIYRMHRNNESSSAGRAAHSLLAISITYVAGGVTPSSTSLCRDKISRDGRRSCATTASTVYKLGIERTHG